MSLDKKRQTYLLSWLKQHAKKYQSNLRASILTGFILTLFMIAQAALLATILQKIIIEQVNFSEVLIYFLLLIVILLARAILIYFREKINFALGRKVRNQIRQDLINQFEALGPAYLNQSTTGALSTLVIEQVDNLQDFFARYLPQMRLASMAPIIICIAILPFNWAAAAILLCTAPLIPIFMILVGMGAADINRRHFKALAYLSGHFLDRLKGLSTIRLFNQGEKQANEIKKASEDFRVKTMQVLKMAFLSSAVLEFFASISIAVVAVYFGFSYLGEFDFGSYSGSVTLFAGFFALILAPEFFQPLRDLGTYYHAKAEAIAAADNIETFLTQKSAKQQFDNATATIDFNDSLQTIEADNLIVLSSENKPIVGPLSFTLKAPFKLALIGTSGEGKTSLMQVLLGFLPYQGSLKINGIEFNQLTLSSWQKQISWIGQNPYLINGSIRENILLGNPNATDQQLASVISQAQLAEVIAKLPNGLDTQVGEDAIRLSVGQAQRIALARAMLKPCQLLILDEPTASLDKQTVQNLEHHNIATNSITITHQNEDLHSYDSIWQLSKGLLHCHIKESL
ncbi:MULTISPECIES: heme ABC transporter permease/ATP-binding protein CydD [unclassified Gilliamella]|uniref:heme ABC transporter permease/ATP-binding protein CydD n=1 Tax=unclassified Gilliamella TaxID=2685620 RepID=UPI002269BB17|nr:MULTISPECIES: cysteine/glutathione ABC transporter permease/ATP-binding protein CydD [unclassified Gilliamella]MCX8601045.1 cysteine/glutathione ABC transporter permease/ATP-binding protein CydD [Gilliamella sp. B3722]MCX8608300.1 cysteine/glutathione ABC transporter permease/ATP-binding protein CydD [Gilliamella sp. B3771]MCX8610267.1 cysteine/glutathione ABC transporter permease/ATP-binding protein CydD [Gilliamella sp. B3891]MCX8612473.1 cysteine/glutathione ABC transporter permease/ATP-b